MSVISVRELTRNDLAAAAEVCTQALAYDPMSEADLLKLQWEDPDFDERYNLVARMGDQMAGLVLGVIRPDAKAGKVGYLKLLAVRPQMQRQGVGKRLVAELEERLRAAGASEVRVSGSAPCYIWPGMDVRYTEAWCLFRQLGYHRYADATNMTVDLEKAPLDTSADEAELANHGIRVRRLDEADRDAFVSYIEKWGPSWRWEALASYGNDPISCHVALHQGAFVGFAAYDANLRGWFGPMGTDQEMRRFGIGRILLKRCLQDQREKGYGTAQIAWTGPYHFYAKAVGARMERVFWLLKKELAPA